MFQIQIIIFRELIAKESSVEMEQGSQNFPLFK